MGGVWIFSGTTHSIILAVGRLLRIFKSGKGRKEISKLMFNQLANQVNKYTYKYLTNQVRGPYFKLQTEFFSR